MLVSTMDEPSTHIITAIHGLVIGVEARPLNRYQDGVKALAPGDSQDFPVRLRDARQKAVDRMVQRARDTYDANGIVGVRFDTRPIADTWVELCAYGTAVTMHAASFTDLDGYGDATLPGADSAHRPAVDP